MEEKRMTKKLWEPITINTMTLKNRMIVSAMVTSYADAQGMATEKYIAYHEATSLLRRLLFSVFKV